MTDVFGTEIREGHEVATNLVGYTCALVVGTVIGFTPKKVRLEVPRRYGLSGTEIITKFPEQLAVNHSKYYPNNPRS